MNFCTLTKLHCLAVLKMYTSSLVCKYPSKCSYKKHLDVVADWGKTMRDMKVLRGYKISNSKLIFIQILNDKSKMSG